MYFYVGPWPNSNGNGGICPRLHSTWSCLCASVAKRHKESKELCNLKAITYSTNHHINHERPSPSHKAPADALSASATKLKTT